MPSWRDEYVASIREADKTNPVNASLILACSALQDLVAVLQAENALLKTSPLKPSTAEPSRSPGTADASSSEAPVTQLRVDLTEALRSQGKLQVRLKAAEGELETLRLGARNHSHVIRSLTNERNSLLVKVRDRDEELRGKSKLVEEVQDELIALNLQLNVAEQQRDKIRKENKELVDRWMQRMGQEAEAMNMASEPYFARSP